MSGTTVDIGASFADGAGISNFGLMIAVIIIFLLITMMFSSALISLGHEVSKGNEDKGQLFKNIWFIVIAIAFMIAIFSILTL